MYIVTVNDTKFQTNDYISLVQKQFDKVMENKFVPITISVTNSKSKNESVLIINQDKSVTVTLNGDTLCTVNIESSWRSAKTYYSKHKKKLNDDILTRWLMMSKIYYTLHS